MYWIQNICRLRCPSDAKSSIAGFCGLDARFGVTEMVTLTSDGKTLRDKIIEANMGSMHPTDGSGMTPQQRDKKMIDDVENERDRKRRKKILQRCHRLDHSHPIIHLTQAPPQVPLYALDNVGARVCRSHEAVQCT